ncbi:MAG: DUF1730 domain-containing protein, partial [Planctomycetales bacterium]|nr:DUF1730 domain-containing protein [Planctomycetales bacterium]
MVMIAEQLKQQARQLGFVLSGVAPAAEPGRLEAFHAWLDAGYAGQMNYLHEHRQAYSHPRNVLDGCRSILMLAMPYGSGGTHDAERRATLWGRREGSRRGASSHIEAGTGEYSRRGASSHIKEGTAKVARYAQGSADYHDVIHGRLKRLRLWLLEQSPGALVRGVVDTAPLLERELAEAAGLGWIGKNTLLR